MFGGVVVSGRGVFTGIVFGGRLGGKGGCFVRGRGDENVDLYSVILGSRFAGLNVVRDFVAIGVPEYYSLLHGDGLFGLHGEEFVWFFRCSAPPRS